MGATFARLKNWALETLTNTDLNAEIDNILNNLGPAGVDDYSTNSAQMRTATDPGEAGSESLATSLAGELERIRFALKEIKGTDVDYWYETADTSLSDLRTLLAGSANRNYISAGKESSRSSQLTALIPSGTTASLTLDAAPTNFVAYISGGQYSATADVTITGLSLAPSAGNTCLVDDTAATAQYHRHLGEYGSVINVDNMGTAFAAFVGKIAGCKIVSSGNTEYFLAYVNSTTSLTKARRGMFYDSSQAAIKSINFADNNTITLVRPTWVFFNTSASMVVTYNQPTYAASQPSSPSTGDYWYDLANNVWKTYNSVTWVTANATLIGMCLQDTAATVAARTFDQAVALSDLNTIDLEHVGSTQIQVKNYGAKTSIFGTAIDFGMHRPVWDITADLDTGISESANTTYYAYLKENGAPVLSDEKPTDRRGDLLGYYHPTETWRCVGHILNNGSSNFTASQIVAFSRSSQKSFFSNDDAPVGDHKLIMATTPEPGYLEADGSALSRFRYAELFNGSIQAIGTACGTDSAYNFNIAASRGRFPRFWDHGASIDPDTATASRTPMATGGNNGDNLGSVQADAFQSHVHQMPVGQSSQVLPYQANFNSTNSTQQDTSGPTTGRTSSETRPKNFNIMLVVKVLK